METKGRNLAAQFFNHECTRMTPPTGYAVKQMMGWRRRRGSLTVKPTITGGGGCSWNTRYFGSPCPALDRFIGHRGHSRANPKCTESTPALNSDQVSSPCIPVIRARRSNCFGPLVLQTTTADLERHRSSTDYAPNRIGLVFIRVYWWFICLDPTETVTIKRGRARFRGD